MHRGRIRRRAQQGSVIIYVLIMVLSISIIITVAAELGMSDLRQQIRYEDATLAQRTWDAAVSQIDADQTLGNLTLPNTRSFAVNGVSGSITTIDNSSSMPNSLLASGTLTTPDSRTYPFSSILCKSASNMLWNYALAVNGSFATNTLTTGSSGSLGDIYVAGNLSVDKNTTVNGKADVTGSITVANGGSITGTQTQSFSPAITWPSPSGANYLSNATTYYSADATLNGYTFPSVSAGQPYPIVYVTHDLHIKGAISGIGTFYVGHLLSLSGPLTYANSSSCVAFVTSSGVNQNLGGQNAVGYYFVPATFGLGPGRTLTGGVAANALAINNTTITLDPTIKANPYQGQLMHLPGLWP